MAVTTAADELGLPPEAAAFAVFRRALASKEFAQLPPTAAAELALALLVELAPAAAGSLWILDAAGSTTCLVSHGKAPRSRRLREAGRAALDGVIVGSAQVHVRVVERWDRPYAALVARGRAAESEHLEEYLEETANALAPLLERASLFDRRVQREHDLVAAGERRIMRLGFDLHDGPLQEIVALAEELRTASTQIAAVVPDDFRQRVRGRFNDVHARLGALDESLREIAHSIRSSTAVARPVADAVGAELRALENATGIEVDLQVEGNLSSLSDSQKIVLFRVVQEALSNVRKHSAAREGLGRPTQQAHLRRRHGDGRRVRLPSAAPRHRPPRPRRDLRAGAVTRWSGRDRDESGRGDDGPRGPASVASVDTRGRYDLRSNFVSRRVLIASVLLAVAGFSAAVVLPTRALAGGTGTTTTTTGATTTTPKPPSGPKVVSAFPAAGEMLVHSVAVRKTPNPHASVIKVMKAFRPDFRPQEMFAVRKATGSDGEVWYRISIPMRPNGTFGWIPASTVSLKPTHSQIVINLQQADDRPLPVRQAQVAWAGRHRSAGQGDAGRPLLRRDALRPVPRHIPRRLRRGDERLLEAHRVAGWRCRRHPRHQSPAAARPGRLARLRACLEHDGPASQDARAARHADLDQEVAERNWKAGRPSAARKPEEPRAR